MEETRHVPSIFKALCLCRPFFLFILLANLVFQSAISQQISETGLPNIQNYSADEYGAFIQNWGAVQDSLGIIYFANGDGILSYNGANWNLLEMPGLVSINAIASTNKGEIYVGGVDELGYLDSNIKGQLSYISLLPKLPEKFRDFSRIRSVYSTKDGVFFSSKKYTFKWDGLKFKTWENSGDPFLFLAGNTLFKRMQSKGLMKFVDNEFKLIRQGELFANKKVLAVLPFNKREFLIAAEDQLLVYNGNTFTKFDTNVPDFFTDNTINCGIALNTNTFAFGTIKKGIVILDENGQKKVMLSKKGMLQSNNVHSLFQDRSGLLWASLNSGIAKIEYPSPFSFYNKHNNAPGLITCFQRYQEKLYVGTGEGLYYLKNNISSQVSLLKPLGDMGLVFETLLHNDRMLVGSRTGLYEINQKGEPKELFDLPTVASLCASKIDSNRVFIGTSSGLNSIYFKNGGWTLDHVFKGISSHVSKITEDNKGNLWLAINKNEVIRVSFNSATNTEVITNPEVKIFSVQDGVPDNIGRLYYIAGQIYIESANKLYVFDPLTEQFISDKKLLQRLGLENKKAKVHETDENGNIWLIEYDEENKLEQLVALIQKNGTYLVKELGEKRIINLRKNEMFLELEDSVIWYRGKIGAIRHDLKQKSSKNTLNSRAIITSSLWQNDSLIFGGYASSIVSQLPFNNNQLRFQYASPSFYDESKNQFQVYLEGFDADWSSWTSETKKDYTNIPAGDYSFKVKAKNIFNEISEEDSYSFTILPPWHQTWWMYLIYGLGAITLVVLISQWRSKELQRKNIALEGVVKERIMEIKHKNELLSQQTEKLMQLNDAKTRLYTNVTHEFRTPLTVILGMADALKTDAEKEKFKQAEKPLKMIKRNGKKLLRLVNEMLDLAKLESGNIEVRLVQADVIPFVKYLSESFHSLAEERKVNLTVYSEIDALKMDFDADKLTSIISNLLSNAIKFTPENGKIIVHLNKIQQQGNDFFAIKIKDSGQGISEEELPNIFNRFHQADTSTSRPEGGTGIGLALVKELVELMNGTISVESTLRKGSVFAVQIPITNTAIKTTDTKTTIETPVAIAREPSKTEQSILNVDHELPLALIIEDNEDVAHYLRTCLKGKYQTVHAINGIIGIEMAYEKIPDIIISDVMMPGKDGFEVCETLKTDERTDHIPIILLTAKVTMKDRLTGLSHGADAYLAKPFVKEELFTRLDQLIALREKMLKKISIHSFGQLITSKEDSPETKFIKKVVTVISEEMHRSTFGPVQLAQKLSLSESQIYRKLKAITNISTAIYIRSFRLQKAKEMLKTTSKTVSEIAYDVGFNDPSWFSRAFKEEFGSAPNDIRK